MITGAIQARNNFNRFVGEAGPSSIGDCEAEVGFIFQSVFGACARICKWMWLRSRFPGKISSQVGQILDMELAMRDSFISPTHEQHSLPSLGELGPDLLHVGLVRKCFSIVLPLAFVAGYFWLADRGLWPLAVLAAVAYTFFSYGSTSHDLVHGNLGLPRWLNHILLSVIELAGLRSGHAYRAAHLHHHARFPHDDDIEATAAHGTLLGALAAGPGHQIKVWYWAMRHAKHDRIWIVAEGFACAAIVIASIAVCRISIAPLVWVILVVLGSWTFPLITAYVPHDPHGKDPLAQTRRFRGKVAAVLFLQHLYHLEHHLYPAVPHQHWYKLAQRLDPYLDEAGVESIRLGI
jgi:beta-carotene hydroxylase